MTGQCGHLGPMTERTTKRPEGMTMRPEGFIKPAYWTNDPAPEPAAPTAEPDPAGLSPTRYGDWEKNGIAIDF